MKVEKVDILLLFLLSLMSGLFLSSTALGQKVPCNQITADMNYTVKSVKVIGRWIPKSFQSRIEGIVGKGKLFDPSNVNKAQKAVEEEFKNDEFKFAIKTIGATSVLLITSDACDISDETHPKEVEVVIHPYYLRVDLFKIGDNILPLPRTSKATLFSNIPSALIAVAPILWFANDRQYGTSSSIKTKTDLLHIPGVVDPDEGSKKLRLNLELIARHSLNYSFYNYGISLNLARPIYKDNALGWALGIQYNKSLQPLVYEKYEREYTQIFGELQGNGNITFLNKYIIGAGIRFLQNRFSTSSTNELNNTDNGYQLYALSDGSLGNSLIRAGAWFDKGSTQKSITMAYDRLAGRVSFSKSLSNNHNNFAIEITTGGGYIWGSSPVYNQFFAGNSAWNFLYDPFNSLRNKSFPEGPIIRSIGEKEGGLDNSNGSILGGTSYLHLNFNLSTPTIKKLTRPLIPDISISESPRRITLRSALKGAVETAKNAIIDDLVKEGSPDDSSTEEIADRIVNKDIRPPLNFLADRANIYAIKPLLLFDVSKISQHNLANNVWISAGGGVQINIVTAQLEAGYMRTVYTTSEVSQGNFFIRLILQNFY